jgi:hypothetical protein
MMSRHLTITALGCLNLLIISGTADAGEQARTVPVVSRVHWITVHARTPEAFDSLYALFSRDLELPVFFSPEQHGARRYAAVLAGNVILEPCGPFPDSGYRSATILARWNTLTFRPSQSTADTQAQLKRQGVRHGSPRTEPWDGKQISVDILGVNSPGMPVTVSECVEGEQALRAKLDALRAEMKSRKGGRLGIHGLDEVRIACTTEGRVAQWQAFLCPIQAAEGVWPLSLPPHLRLVRGDRDEIVALVLKVESLARAVKQLKAMDMLGAQQGNMAAIKGGRTCGLAIYLRE